MYNPDQDLPGCMLPDGGDACGSYQRLAQAYREALSKLNDALDRADSAETLCSAKDAEIQRLYAQRQEQIDFRVAAERDWQAQFDRIRAERDAALEAFRQAQPITAELLASLQRGLTMWTQEQAIELCKELEAIAPQFGGHVALTGGCLYKDGTRKDVDVMCYRSTDEPPFDWSGFFERIARDLGIELVTDYGFCKKAKVGERIIDFFDPFGEYHGESSVSEGPCAAATEF